VQKLVDDKGAGGIGLATSRQVSQLQIIQGDVQCGIKDEKQLGEWGPDSTASEGQERNQGTGVMDDWVDNEAERTLPFGSYHGVSLQREITAEMSKYQR